MIIRRTCVLWTNIQTLCSSATPKSTNIGQSWYERNYVNIFTIGLKNFCNSRPFSLISSSTDQEIITEGERTKLLRWIELCRFEDDRMPKNISEEQFLELFKAKNEAKRKKFLNYLFKREAARENQQKRKEIKSLEVQQRREKKLSFQTDHIDYGLWKNALFIKSSKRHVIDLYNHRLITSMQFGQPLVIDLGFDDHMEGREITSFAEQLVLTISMNRKKSREPFNLTFCNVNFDSKPFRKFTHIMPNILDPSYPLKMHKESYLDIFPKEKLVYLTPNAREEMEQYDHEAIYIIGGIVDLGNQRPLTLAKAKKEKIKMQKLPLDKYVVFKGHKSLGIHVMLAILGDIQEHGDWRKAFEYIPKRLINAEDRDTGDRSTSLWNKKRSLF